MDESPTPRWQKLIALGLAVTTAVLLLVFRKRLGADFWPLDASRVGPNLIASLVQWALVFVAAILIWPPWRRRLHRFVDAKIAPLHERLARLHADHRALHDKADRLHARHVEHTEHLDRIGRSLAELHEKLDSLKGER